MISPEHAQLMARYNHWQNGSLYTAAETLSAEDLTCDRGSFFGAILPTLSHILWGDQIWWSRFLRQPRPAMSNTDTMTHYKSLAALKPDRAEMDRTILSWAGSLSPQDLSGDLTWFSGAAQEEKTMPLWLCITHAYNHQTHHRGQAHAMLTAAGAAPDDTDIFLMPA